MKKYFIKISWFLAFIILMVSNECIAQSNTLADSKPPPINPANIDTTVDPNLDFYEYSNGNWLRNNPVPPEYSRWSVWSEIVERNNEKLRMILEEAVSDVKVPSGSNKKKLGDLYFSAMDTITIENAGISPLAEDLAKIDAIENMEDFQRVFSYMKTFRNGGLFNCIAGQDDKNSQNVILQLFQSGLGMPSKDYYLKEDEKSAKL